MIQRITSPRQILLPSRKISLIVLHCSATRSTQEYSLESLERDHRARGFDGIGYHFYILRSGELYLTRSLERVGAHAKGHNLESIGVCYEGGLDAQGRPADTRTSAQRQTLSALLHALVGLLPNALIVGHRDLSPDRNHDGKISPQEWTRECPCFSVRPLALALYARCRPSL